MVGGREGVGRQGGMKYRMSVAQAIPPAPAQMQASRLRYDGVAMKSILLSITKLMTLRPHPRSLSPGEREENPFSLGEKAGMRARLCTNI